MRVSFVLIFLSISFSAIAVQTLEVRSHTVVQTSEAIYLSDIVELKDMPQSLVQSLKTVKLSNGPKLGERQVLSSESISRLIRKHLSQLNIPEKLRLKIPSQVIVENQGYVISKDHVIKQLSDHWKTFCQDCEFQVSQLSLPKMPSQLQPFEWKILLDAKTPAGQFSYRVQGENSTIGWVQGLVRVFQKVPVTTRSIHFGERLNKEDVVKIRKEITYAHDSPANFENLMGRRTKRAMSAGDIIWTNNLEKNLATRRGNPVKIVIGSSEWQLSLQGIAQMDGQIGDTISVKNPRSQKIISGVLVNDGEVRVQ